MQRWETSAAAGLAGFALYEMYSAYRGTAPTLTELRDADQDCVEQRQKLLDADVCVGGLVLLAGITASWLSRSWIPILVTTAGFAWISAYHHLVQQSPTPDQI